MRDEAGLRTIAVLAAGERHAHRHGTHHHRGGRRVSPRSRRRLRRRHRRPGYGRWPGGHRGRRHLSGPARHRHRSRRVGDDRGVPPCRGTAPQGWPAERALRRCLRRGAPARAGGHRRPRDGHAAVGLAPSRRARPRHDGGPRHRLARRARRSRRHAPRAGRARRPGGGRRCRGPTRGRSPGRLVRARSRARRRVARDRRPRGRSPDNLGAPPAPRIASRPNPTASHGASSCVAASRRRPPGPEPPVRAVILRACSVDRARTAASRPRGS